jgi:hypothetical protein
MQFSGRKEVIHLAFLKIGKAILLRAISGGNQELGLFTD